MYKYNNNILLVYIINILLNIFNNKLKKLLKNIFVNEIMKYKTVNFFF